MGFATGIRVITRFEGLHHWPTAPAPEEYLQSPHRHEFVVHLDAQVHHGDREIEINNLARWLNGLIPGFATTPAAGGGPADYGTQSCEQLARRIITAFTTQYGVDREVTCAVLEDGLHGGTVTWRPDHPALQA